MVHGFLASSLRRSGANRPLLTLLRAARIRIPVTIATTTLFTVIGASVFSSWCAADEGPGSGALANPDAAAAPVATAFLATLTLPAVSLVTATLATEPLSTATLATAIVAGDVTSTMSPVTLRLRKEDSEFTNFAAEGTPWVFRDARGTGLPWALTVSATNFARLGDSPSDLDDASPELLIPPNALQITLGAVSPQHGADAAPAAESVTLSGRQQTLIAARAPAKGSYTVRPSFDLRVVKKAAALRGKSFVCTITYTMG